MGHMDDYGYVNARVRSLFPKLLTRQDYDRMINDELRGIFDALRNTPYGPFIKNPEPEDMIAGFKARLQNTVEHILSYASGEPGFLIRVLLARWDVHNLLTILRGKLRSLPESEIRADLMPGGALNSIRLEQLIAERDASRVLDRIASWGLDMPVSITRTLTKMIRDKDLPAVEFHMQEAYYAWARGRLNPRKPNHRVLLKVLSDNIDIRNIVAVLIYLRDQVKPKGRVRFLPGGGLPKAKLRALENCETYEDALAVLRHTSYAFAFPRIDTPPTEAERAMEMHLIRWSLSQRVRGDQLGIGPAVAFISALSNEVVNLRTIVLAKSMGADESELRKNLILA